MRTYYALIDGEISPLRIPQTEVKRDRWAGYLVSTSLNGLVKLINRGV